MSGSTTVGIHDVEKITIEKRHHREDEDCFEFVVIRIRVEMKDGREPLVVDLYMNETKLNVRPSSTSPVERIIEVAR